MNRKILTLLFPIFILTISSCNALPEMDSLYISQKPFQTTYNIGETFDAAGLSVISTKTREKVEGYQLSLYEGYEFTFEDIGVKEVTVSKSGYRSTSFELRIENKPQLVVSHLPNKTTYYRGECFDTTGLVITCNDEVVNNYNLSIDSHYQFVDTGTYQVTISKTGYYSTSFGVEVIPALELKVYSLPTKTTYEQGEVLDLRGLVIYDQNDHVVTDYQTSISDGDFLKRVGEVEIVVSKTDYRSTSFNITVTEHQGGEVVNNKLKIYYINDTHGAYIRQQIEDNVDEAGISYIGQYIKEEVAKDKERGDYSIVLSGGDMFQGTIDSNLTYGDIMVDAMNIIGFDAMVLGNHEFDWGESNLMKFAANLNCPIISCNTFYKETGKKPSYLSSYAIIERENLKIGIIGAARKGMDSSITGSISSAFSFPEPNSYIKDCSDLLRTSYNCDIVIGAFHDEGYEAKYDEKDPSKFFDITEFSSETGERYVDAMFFAHDHYAKNNTFNGVRYIESGCNGRYVGEMTFSLSNQNNVYTIDSVSAVNHRAYDWCEEDNEDISDLADTYASVIGKTDEVIYNFKKDYTIDEFTEVVVQAMWWFVNNNLSLFDNQTVYFASHNTGGVRSSVKHGSFTRRDLYKVFPFDNQLCIQTCTETNINNMKASTYYRTYSAEEIIYDEHERTKAVSISYICEYKYAYNYQVSFKEYDLTAKDALVSFLTNNAYEEVID